MKVELTRVNEKIRFIVKAGDNTMYVDGPPSLGGEEQGFRPMQLLLSALASCASVDFASMLYKQGVELEDFLVEIEGDRQPEAAATPFTKIRILFILQGDIHIPRPLVEQFASRSVHELCSVGATLREETKIEYRIEYR